MQGRWLKSAAGALAWALVAVHVPAVESPPAAEPPPETTPSPPPEAAQAAPPPVPAEEGPSAAADAAPPAAPPSGETAPAEEGGAETSTSAPTVGEGGPEGADAPRSAEPSAADAGAGEGAAPDAKGAAAASDAALAAQQVAGLRTRYGRASFPVSCAPGVQEAFAAGVALIHAFEHARARRLFGAIAAADPACAMAEWGIAISHWRPLAGAPETEVLAAGRAALGRALERGPATRREAAWVEALAAYHEGDGVDPRGRIEAMLERLRQLREELPDDVELGAFYGLALLASAPPEDGGHVRQQQAVRVLAELHAGYPAHPGAAHYLALAREAAGQLPDALPPAQRYAEIAPGSMSAWQRVGRLAARLGLWAEALPALRRGAEIAREDAEPAARAAALGAVLDAALQSCREGEGAQALAALDGLAADTGTVAAKAQADGTARWLLTREDWQGAAALAAVESPPRAAAVVLQARAVGAVRQGDVETARAAAAALESLADAAPDDIELQALARAAAGALADLEGDKERAFVLLAQAAALDERAMVWPPPALPAQVLWGDLLLAGRQPGAALVAYETALAHYPNRRSALAGAARAAIALDEPGRAEAYYARLVDACPEPDGPVPVLAAAKKFLSTPRAAPAKTPQAEGAGDTPP